MAYFSDYREELKKFISEAYLPGVPTDNMLELSTSQILERFAGFFPKNAIDEHDIYECMKELGYKPVELQPLLFVWQFRRIDPNILSLPA